VHPIPDQHRIIEVMLRSIRDDGMDLPPSPLGRIGLEWAMHDLACNWKRRKVHERD